MKTALINRLCLGSLLLFALACGGGSLTSTANRVNARLERSGSTTAALTPGSSTIVELQVTSLDAALNLDVTFDFDPAHFEPIAPVQVILTKGVPATVQFELRARAVSGVNGEIDMNIDAPISLTTEPLTYTIDSPAP